MIESYTKIKYAIANIDKFIQKQVLIKSDLNKKSDFLYDMSERIFSSTKDQSSSIEEVVESIEKKYSLTQNNVMAIKESHELLKEISYTTADLNSTFGFFKSKKSRLQTALLLIF